MPITSDHAGHLLYVRGEKACICKLLDDVSSASSKICAGCTCLSTGLGKIPLHLPLSVLQIPAMNLLETGGELDLQVPDFCLRHDCKSLFEK